MRQTLAGLGTVARVQDAVSPKLFTVIVVTTALPATTVPLLCADVSVSRL